MSCAMRTYRTGNKAEFRTTAVQYFTAVYVVHNTEMTTEGFYFFFLSERLIKVKYFSLLVLTDLRKSITFVKRSRDFVRLPC
jgi:hypothetical protein